MLVCWGCVCVCVGESWAKERMGENELYILFLFLNNFNLDSLLPI